MISAAMAATVKRKVRRPSELPETTGARKGRTSPRKHMKRTSVKKTVEANSSNRPFAR